ncbi:unnamed protein product, partial [Arabidopsis halleri]
PISIEELIRQYSDKLIETLTAKVKIETLVPNFGKRRSNSTRTMIRNAVAKGKLLLQYRDFSSATNKEAPPSGGMMKIAEDLIGICYIAAVGGVGFVLGGLSSTSEAPAVEQDAKILSILHKDMDEKEIMLKKRLEEKRLSEQV